MKFIIGCLIAVFLLVTCIFLIACVTSIIYYLIRGGTDYITLTSIGELGLSFFIFLLLTVAVNKWYERYGF